MPRSNIAKINDPAITISVGVTGSMAKNATELYDYTRGIWRVNRDRASKARYALAVSKGEIIEVYEIDSWHRARTTPYKSNRDFLGTDPTNRSEFVGRVASEAMRNKYVGKRIEERSYGAPVRYYNCD
jgi:uncharacterized protein